MDWNKFKQWFNNDFWRAFYECLGLARELDLERKLNDSAMQNFFTDRLNELEKKTRN